MDSYHIQYVAVIIILICVVAWILRKLFLRKDPGRNTSCCGCSLKDNCMKGEVRSLNSGSATSSSAERCCEERDATCSSKVKVDMGCCHSSTHKRD